MSSIPSLIDLIRPFRRLLHAALFAVLVLAAVLAGSGRVDAQSSYGVSSYGTETYSTEAAGNPADDVKPPNTGFQVVDQAAERQPVIFWGSIGAVAMAIGLMIWIVINRKKEKQ